MSVNEIYEKFLGTVKVAQDAMPAAPGNYMGDLSKNLLETAKSWVPGAQAPAAPQAPQAPQTPKVVEPVAPVAVPKANLSAPAPAAAPSVDTANIAKSVPKPDAGVQAAPAPVKTEGVPAASPTDKPSEPGLIDSAKGTVATAGANALIKNVMTAAQENPQGFGITDWLKNNWGAIAVPAGLLLSVFGGRTGAILGGIALGAGGANLYGRYQTLMSKEAQPALQKVIGSNFDKGVIEQLQKENPTLGQAALDLQAAIHYGFATDVIKGIQSGGEAAIKGFKMSPEAEATILQRYREGTQADTSQLPGMTTWGSTAKDYVGGLYDKGVAGVKGMMQ